MTNQNINQDPRDKEPQPPFPKQEQELPGTEQAMEPKPDHGEETYQGHSRLKGKAAVITGADSGIGKAVALAFAREGADVLISYWKEDQDAEETRRLVEEAGAKAVLFPGDIRDESVCKGIIQKAVDEFGRLDILVNNAAYQTIIETLDGITQEVIEHTFATNIFAMFYLAKAAVPHMKPGSAIINTASIQAYRPDGFLLTYASTKGAIVTFTKGLAQMLTEQGIRVNAVAPGPIWTPLIPASFSGKHTAEFGKNTPTQRAAQPVEVAPIYVLLASDEASYMSGSIYDVTGGKFTA